MGFREFLQTLEHEGIQLEEHHIRYAIRRRKISRPELDASLSFVFEKEHVEQARKLTTKPRGKAQASVTEVSL